MKYAAALLAFFAMSQTWAHVAPALQIESEDSALYQFMMTDSNGESWILDYDLTLADCQARLNESNGGAFSCALQN